MPASSGAIPTLWSRGFTLWKQKERQAERRITVETVVADTKLSRNTVRRFLDPDADVSGATLGAAQVMATYLGTDLAELIVNNRGGAEATSDIAREEAVR